jgi:hypothetical protein
MEDINKAFDTFLGEESKAKTVKTEKTKKINTKSGEIIEHVQKKLIVEDGRELLL